MRTTALALVFVFACNRDPQITEVRQGSVTAVDDTSQEFVVPVGLGSVGCRLYMNPDQSQNFWLQTDARGYARFWFSPVSAIPTASVGHLDCTDDAGGLHSQTIDLAQLGPQQAAVVAAMPPKPGTWFQPLAGDPESYSQADLLAIGLPPRPAKGSPKWAQWLDIASRSRFRPAGKSLPNPDVKRVQYNTSDHQCGAIIQNGAYPLLEAVGLWNLPQWQSGVTVHAISSSWVGVSGYGVDELIQAGADTNNLSNGHGGWTYSYNTFWEYYSIAHGDHQGTFSVTAVPNDEYYFDVWASDVNGYMTATGGFGAFYVYDYNDGETDYKIESAPSGVTYHGYSAEWVTERPWSGSSWFPLAKTKNIQFFSHEAFDGTSYYNVPDPSGFYINVTMKNSSNQYLCSCFLDSSGYINNQWYRAQ